MAIVALSTRTVVARAHTAEQVASLDLANAMLFRQTLSKVLLLPAPRP